MKQGKKPEINQKFVGISDLNSAITQKQQREFEKVLKRGIYKELYKRNFLTSQQLTQLLDAEYSSE